MHRLGQRELPSPDTILDDQLPGERLTMAWTKTGDVDTILTRTTLLIYEKEK